MRSYLSNCSFCWIGAAAIACLLAQAVPAQVPQSANPSAKAPATADDTPAAEQTGELHAKFKKLLTGAKLRGQFTVDGQPLNKVQEEAYDIEKVDKLPDGDCVHPGGGIIGNLGAVPVHGPPKLVGLHLIAAQSGGVQDSSTIQNVRSHGNGHNGSDERA